jgi:hypothetical protein
MKRRRRSVRKRNRQRIAAHARAAEAIMTEGRGLRSAPLLFRRMVYCLALNWRISR